MGNKHLANVLLGHLQMKSVLEQYGVSTDNETAYKKVRNDVLIKLSRYDTFAR